ncbi:MAG: DRTGG domain-containing protein [Planctomycetota bacterium]|nr:DRTGG domain-containing protein [Planctomycetota bacterium]MDI6788549.1 DRTGG domain-containing protein [Planctomycetota bacterium]
MKTLFISSVNDAAGKNMLIAGIGQKMMDDKYNIGFLKPIANKPFRFERTLTDEDALFFHKLFNLEREPISNLCSLVVTNELYEGIISGKTKIDLSGKVSQSIEKISRDKDIILIKGLGRFYRGSGFGESELNLIKNFNWQTILVDAYRSNRFSLPLDLIDGFIMGKKVLGNFLIGVVFNYVPQHQMGYIKDKVVPYLYKEHKIEVLGIIPADARLKAVSIAEIKNMLNAEILCGADKQNDIIEEFCLSTMNMENDLRYFRQVDCKAVIISGDRPEIQLASLETDTKCLILTGKLYPSDIVLSKVEESNIPVLVVRDSSLETAEKIERLRQHLGLYSPSKIPTAIKIVQRNVNIKTIYKKLGILSRPYRMVEP